MTLRSSTAAVSFAPNQVDELLKAILDAQRALKAANNEIYRAQKSDQLPAPARGFTASVLNSIAGAQHALASSATTAGAAVAAVDPTLQQDFYDAFLAP